MRLFTRQFEMTEYRRALKTVALEDCSSMATGHGELRVILYWFPINLFVLDDPDAFSAFSVLRAFRNGARVVGYNKAISDSYRSVSVWLNGNPATESPAI